jgi:prepilin-type N-terminal cleavage/methylation domain-containing protein
MKCVSALVRECVSERHRAAPPRLARAGFTLVELMVVLAILGVMAGVAGLAARSVDTTDPASARASLIADARRRALETRRPVAISVDVDGSARRVLALPDGSVRADSALGLDALTGRPRAAR